MKTTDNKCMGYEESKNYFLNSKMQPEWLKEVIRKMDSNSVFVTLNHARILYILALQRETELMDGVKIDFRVYSKNIK